MHIYIHNKVWNLYCNCDKYPLSPLKPRGLALLSRHVPYNWGSQNSVHQSFTRFLTLNWRKSTFYRPPGADIISKSTADGLLWRHRHMGQPLAIVTSQWSIFPTGIYGRMMLRWTQVKGIAITCEALNDFIILHIVVEWFIVQYATLRDQKYKTCFGLKICLFTLLIIFGLPCFSTGH